MHSFILPTPGFLFLFFVAGSANYPECCWFVEKERWRIFAADWLRRADDFTNKSVLKDCSLKKKKKIFYKYCAWWLLMERIWFLLIITEISLWLILWCTWYPLFHCYCDWWSDKEKYISYFINSLSKLKTRTLSSNYYIIDYISLYF